MIRNMGSTDRTIRVGIGLAIIAVLSAGAATGALGWVLGVVSVIMLATALMSWCPLYSVLGISTNRAAPHRP